MYPSPNCEKIYTDWQKLRNFHPTKCRLCFIRDERRELHKEYKNKIKI